MTVPALGVEVREPIDAALKVIEEYANDLREIIKKLGRRPKKAKSVLTNSKTRTQRSALPAASNGACVHEGDDAVAAFGVRFHAGPSSMT